MFDKKVETDAAEYSSLITDVEAASHFREETRNYVRYCLVGEESPDEYEKPASSIITAFEPIGTAIRKEYSAGKDVARSPLQ